MRIIRYAIWAIIGLFLVTLALANRAPVTLQLLPEDLLAMVGVPVEVNSITLPLFLVILGGIAIGVLLGFIAEWLREHKFRAEARRSRREADALSKELKQMKTEKAESDDVLALLDVTGVAR